MGKAHLLAHRAMNTGTIEKGYRELLDLVGEAESPCSQWLHLQWHLLVFELSLGEKEEACQRFERRLKAPILGSSWVPTDGPSALWRLHLAKANIDLPWAELASRLGSAEDERLSDYERLHLLLVLGGAGRTATLKRWLDTVALDSRGSVLLHRAGRSMLAYAEGDFSRAGLLLHGLCPDVHELGGSSAQNALFPSIARHMFQLAARRSAPGLSPTYQAALSA